MTHSESISKVLHILGILTDHIATSQFATIKSQVTGVSIIQKNTKKNELEWKLAQSVLQPFLVIFVQWGFFRENSALSSRSICGLQTPCKVLKKTNELVPRKLPEGGRKDGSYFMGAYRWRVGVQLEKPENLVFHLEETITLWKTESNEITK